MPDWKAVLIRRLRAKHLDHTQHFTEIEELAQHLEDRYRALVAQGMPIDEAERSVRRELDEDEAATIARELRQLERRSPMPSPPIGNPRSRLRVDGLTQDFRYAVRSLRKSPAFTVVAVVTLALGVGVNTALFSVVNAVMLRPLPYGNPDRLVRLFESNPERGWPEFSTSDLNFLDWQAQATSWEALAATTGNTASITWDTGAEIVRSARVTPEFLRVLGISPALGRDFRSDDVTPGVPAQVAILTDGLWKRLFGADSASVGRVIPLNGQPHTIVGVLPPRFDWGNNLELLVPFAPDPNRPRGDRQLTAIGLLKTGVTIDGAGAELTTIAANLSVQYPTDDGGWTVRLVSFYDWIVPSQIRESLLVLQGAVALVLLIACVNVANLLLARGAARQKEISIRVAIGASRGRILAHGALESLLLAALGTGAGVAFAAMTIRVLSVYASDTVPRLSEASIDAQVLLFAAVSAIAAAALFGLIPSLHAAREHGGQVLQDASRGSTGGIGRQRLRGALTVVEVALSVALLIGAGLLLRSFVTLQQVEPGFDVEAVMTGRVMLADRTAFDTAAKRIDFWRRVTAAASGLPGIVAVSTGSSVPLGSNSVSTELEVDGQPLPSGALPSAGWRVVTPGYFQTMGIPLRGRDFTEADGPDAPPTIIISETLARLYWPNQDPLGKTITPRSLGNRRRTIIGIAGDVRSFGLDREAGSLIYYSGLAAPLFNPMYLVWRSTLDPASHVPAIREAIRRVNPKVALYDVTAARDLLANSFGRRRFNLYLLGLFAAVALVLASVGLFGVMAYLVAQRTREIGVRLALGANRQQVFRLIVGRGALLAGLGAVIGTGAALALTRLMRGLLFSVSPTDPATFAAVPLLLLVVGCAACYIPARRAMKVDPVTALRAE